MEYAAKKNINWNARAIQCDGCDVRFHARCANIGPESFKALNKTEVTWICNHCCIPNTSTHHSIDLDDLKSVNSFQVIAPDSKNVLGTAHYVSVRGGGAAEISTHHPNFG